MRYCAVVGLTPPCPRSVPGSVPYSSMAAHVERSARRTTVSAWCRYAEPGVPPLRPEQVEAMDELAAIADELALQVPFEEGQIQLMNQHVTYHGRTAYADDATAGASRVLLRMWLAMPNSRALPPGHAVQWGTSAAGALRGGAMPGRSAFDA